MALFSRRPKKSTDQPSSQQPAPQPLDEDVAPAAGGGVVERAGHVQEPAVAQLREAHDEVLDG